MCNFFFTKIDKSCHRDTISSEKSRANVPRRQWEKNNWSCANKTWLWWKKRTQFMST